MAKDFIEILKENFEEKKKYFENYRFYCKRIKKEAEYLLGSVKVLVFGSLIKGEFTPRSEIDILIISEDLPEAQEERNRIRTRIKSSVDPFSPFQIHLITPKEYNC